MGAGFLTGVAARGKSTLEHSVPGGVDTMEKIHIGAVAVELHPHWSSS